MKGINHKKTFFVELRPFGVQLGTQPDSSEQLRVPSTLQKDLRSHIAGHSSFSQDCVRGVLLLMQWTNTWVTRKKN